MLRVPSPSRLAVGAGAGVGVPPLTALASLGVDAGVAGGVGVAVEVGFCPEATKAIRSTPMAIPLATKCFRMEKRWPSNWMRGISAQIQTACFLPRFDSTAAE